MTDKRRIRIRWAGRGLVFEGHARDAPPVVLDGESQEGPSPTEALLMSLAACMAIDVKVILEKGRVQVDDVVVEVEGDRAPEPPRRFTSLRITIRVTGPTAADLPKMERAAELSRDKYCSVFHTLRPDLPVEIFSSLG